MKGTGEKQVIRVIFMTPALRKIGSGLHPVLEKYDFSRGGN